MPDLPAHPPHLARYHRQIILPDVGTDGQARLLTRSALLVGCGALGTVIADSLARAGVGHIIIVDRDLVELTNLQRQVLFSESDAADGLPKAVAAATRLRQINSSVRVIPIVADLTTRNAEQLLDIHNALRAELNPAAPASAEDANQLARMVDVVIDGTDNFQTRYLLNDLCVKHHIPLVYGGVVGTSGMQLTIRPGLSPCLRCLFPDPPAPGTSPTCDTAGVLGPVAGMVASLQAVEAIKLILGRADLCSKDLLDLDPWSSRWRRLAVERQPDCACCVQRDFPFLEAAADQTTSLCGTDAVQIGAPSPITLDLAALADRLAAHGRFTATPHLLRGTLSTERDRTTNEPIHLTVFRDARAIIKGTTDPAAARSIYAKYIGA